MTDRLLVCTDLDRTLIPNGPEAESAGARRHFARFASRTEVTLAYVSGRHRSLVEQAISHYRLPPPDYVIGDVGTTIYRVDGQGEWHRQYSWEDEIAADWNGRGHADLAAELRGLPGLRLQERTRQNRCKLSYYVPRKMDHSKLAGHIESRLSRIGVRARLVFSVDEPAGIGLLDVLPRNASKLHAIEALMGEHDFTLAQTVFCGDSGNDLEVLSSPIPSVLVANSSPEVRLEAQALAKANHCEQTLYIACGGFHGMNGNYSAGMLEGIAHYHPEALAWMGFRLEESA